MSFGMRIWDSSGDITLDTTVRTTRLIGVFTFNVPGGLPQGNYFQSYPGINPQKNIVYAGFSNLYVDTDQLGFYIQDPVSTAESFQYALFEF